MNFGDRVRAPQKAKGKRQKSKGKRKVRTLVFLLSYFCLLTFAFCLLPSVLDAQAGAYIGFDRNIYPGDDKLPALRKHFAFTGYWLGLPPGERFNTWTGKRATIESAGFGFLLLYNARSSAALRRDAAKLGTQDGAAAVAAARKEGFPENAVIFLDLEEGGRMSAAQHAYIHAFADAVTSAHYRAGVYCSGIPARDDENVVTAVDIRAHAEGRLIVFWVANDACSASKGCVLEPRDPAESGVPFAAVWQFAQSPRRPEFARGACAATYNRDGNCYAPDLRGIHLDLNAANSSDPSAGRTTGNGTP